MLQYIKDHIVCLAAISFCLAFTNNVSAAMVSWTGGGSNTLASNADNWDSADKPKNGDSVVLSNSSKDCLWDYDVILNSFSSSNYSAKFTKESGKLFIVTKSKVWTGGGSDNKASTDENWTGNQAPDTGDDIKFYSLYTGNIEWDLTISPASFEITSGFAGTVTLTNEMTVTGDFKINSGNMALNTQRLNVFGDIEIGSTGTLISDGTIEVRGNWSRYGTFTAGTNSTVLFSGEDQKLFGSTTFMNVLKSSVVSEPTFLTLTSDITMNGYLAIEKGTMDLNDRNILVTENLVIDEGTTLLGTASNIEVKGDWIGNGTFVPGTSTVTLSGTTQTVWGDNVFYNLTKTGPGDTLTFEANSEQIVLNMLILEGADGARLNLRSTTSSAYWYLDAQGSRNLNYLNIEDLYNLNFADLATLNSIGTNNMFVIFGGEECLY